MGFDPGVLGRFDLAALVQPHLKLLFVCLFICLPYHVPAWACSVLFQRLHQVLIMLIVFLLLHNLSRRV